MGGDSPAATDQLPMRIEDLQIDGLLLIHPDRIGDQRGWFCETWSRPRLEQIGFTQDFVQDNLSYSAEPGTLRGLHCQRAPFDQGKLVGVITGAIRDVAVDVREGSTTYGRHFSIDISEDDPVLIYVPSGFLHGFVTRAPRTRVAYKTTQAYSADHDRSIAWNDPDLAIDWGTQSPILSKKDAAAPTLRDAGPLFPSPSLRS